MIHLICHLQNIQHHHLLAYSRRKGNRFAFISNPLAGNHNANNVTGTPAHMVPGAVSAATTMGMTNAGGEANPKVIITIGWRR